MYNLDEYKPVIDTTTLSDDEIELWFGSKYATKLLRLIEGCELQFYSGENLINYNRNSLTIMTYFFENQRIILSLDWHELGLTNKNYKEVTLELTNILNTLFSFKIKDVK